MTSQVSNQQAVQEHSQSRPTASVLVQSSAALIFGMVILFAVGFAPMGAAHNSAHDVRHSLAFPCH
jgi:cobalt transporter subunit CbtB